MNHQDWREVVLYKPNSKNIKQTDTVKRTQYNKVKEVDIAEGKTIKYVNNNLKKKIETTRLNLRNQQTDKALSRDDFAKSLNIPSKNITLLETGKISEKDAKQIALKIERIYKIKIL